EVVVGLNVAVRDKGDVAQAVLIPVADGFHARLVKLLSGHWAFLRFALLAVASSSWSSYLLPKVQSWADMRAQQTAVSGLSKYHATATPIRQTSASIFMVHPLPEASDPLTDRYNRASRSLHWPLQKNTPGNRLNPFRECADSGAGFLL